MKKNQIIKVVVIIVFCVAIDIFMHIVTGPFSTMPSDPDFSFVADILGTEITASLWALLAFSCVSFVYLRNRDEITGKGMVKGVRYGMAIAMLWIMAMLEGVSLFGNPLINEFVVGASDAIPVFILSILLSMLKTTKKQYHTAGRVLYQRKNKSGISFCGYISGRQIYGIFFSDHQIRKSNKTPGNIHLDTYDGDCYRYSIRSAGEQQSQGTFYAQISEIRIFCFWLELCCIPFVYAIFVFRLYHRCSGPHSIGH